MMFRFYLLFIWLINPSLLFSETYANNEGVLVKQEEQESKSELTLMPFIRVPILNLSLSPKTDDDQTGHDSSQKDVEYEPNIQPSLGGSVSWKDFSLTFSFPVPSSDEEEKELGKTKFRDFDFQFMRELWGFDVGWQEAKGFYRSDSDGSSSAAKDTRPDLKKTGYFANLFWTPFGREYKAWFFGKKSESGSEDVKEDQKEGGSKKVYVSPIFQLSYEEFEIRSKDSLIPENQSYGFGGDSDLNQIRVSAIGLGGGGIIAYHFNKMKVWITISIGGNLQNTSVSQVDGAADSFKKSSDLCTSFRMGYDAEVQSWHAGINVMMDMKEYNLKHSTLDTETGSVVIYASKSLDTQEIF